LFAFCQRDHTNIPPIQPAPALAFPVLWCPPTLIHACIVLLMLAPHSLQKKPEDRPSLTALLEHPFVQRARVVPVDISAWVKRSRTAAELAERSREKSQSSPLPKSRKDSKTNSTSSIGGAAAFVVKEGDVKDHPVKAAQ